MASAERVLSFRHEGYVFFIYDHKKKTEEDDPKDAILYFYPGFVDVDEQIALVGGIIGLVDFCLEFLPQSMPSVVKLSGRNFALLQHEDFIIGLGGSPDTPDAFLKAHMQFVWSTFILYQGSLSALRKRVPVNGFVQELKNVFDYYLPLRQIQEDSLSQAFQVLPYVQLHKSQGHIFLHASHILQRSLTQNGVLAGALFNKNRVLCTQLSNSLTRKFLLLMSQSQFPCVEANSVLELPGGVKLLHIYLPKNEYAKLGYRRKKAYIQSSPTSTERNSADQIHKSYHLSINTPDYTSALNYFADHMATSSAGDMADAGGSSSFREDDSGIQSLNGGHTNGLMTTSTHGLTSGTDSEVFLDTLTDIVFDSENQLRLVDIQQVECATSGKGTTASQLCQTLQLQQSLQLHPASDPHQTSQLQQSSHLDQISQIHQTSQFHHTSQPDQNSQLDQTSQLYQTSQLNQISLLHQISHLDQTSQLHPASQLDQTAHCSVLEPTEITGTSSVTQESNSPSLTPDDDSVQTQTHGEQKTETSDAEENKAELEVNHSFKNVSINRQIPKTDISTHDETLTETLYSCPTDVSEQVTPSCDPRNHDTYTTDSSRYDTPTDTQTQNMYSGNSSRYDTSTDTKIQDTSTDVSSRHDTSVDMNMEDASADDSGRLDTSAETKIQDSSASDSIRLDISADIKTHSTSTEESSRQDTCTKTQNVSISSEDTSRQMSCTDVYVQSLLSEDSCKCDTFSKDTSGLVSFSADRCRLDLYTTDTDKDKIPNDDTTDYDTCIGDFNSCPTPSIHTCDHGNGDVSRQSKFPEDNQRQEKSSTDTINNDTSAVDTSSSATFCTDISRQENIVGGSVTVPDRMLSLALSLDNNGNKCGKEKNVMAESQEHLDGLESSSLGIADVTMVTDSVVNGVGSSSDCGESSYTSTAPNFDNHLANALMSNHQLNKQDSKMNVNEEQKMLPNCHSNRHMVEMNSGEVSSAFLLPNGSVTPQIGVLVKDSKRLFGIESKDGRSADPDSKSISGLGKSDRDFENKRDDLLESSSFNHKLDQPVSGQYGQVGTDLDIKNGLSYSASNAGLANEESRSEETNSVSIANDELRTLRFPLPSGLSNQTFNLTEILAQNKQQIDASLEARLSGDESSTQSSSDLKRDDREVSSYSLAYNEVVANKDRLTFESVDSEYSEGGLVSPVSLQLSPVMESSGPVMDDTSLERSGSKLKINVSKSTPDLSSQNLGKYSGKWDPRTHDLEELTLYAQGHSDTLLVLLVSHTVKWNKLCIQSLWKSCLPHLAELDFQVKDAERYAKDEFENVGALHQYLKYDSFSQNLKGSALQPVTSLANEIVDSSIRMHESFCSMPDLQEITYRSHSACCYGHRMVNTETYFQIGLPRMSAGICPPNDKTFCLDQMAEKILQNDK